MSQMDYWAIFASNPETVASKKPKPMEFEAFVQIDSPKIEIHPMNVKFKSLSTAEWPLKFHSRCFFRAPWEPNMCKSCMEL